MYFNLQFIFSKNLRMKKNIPMLYHAILIWREKCEIKCIILHIYMDNNFYLYLYISTLTKLYDEVNID